MSESGKWYPGDNEWDDDDPLDDTINGLEWDEADTISVQPSPDEECPVCGSRTVIRNYRDKWLFHCLECHESFRNS